MAVDDIMTFACLYPLHMRASPLPAHTKCAVILHQMRSIPCRLGHNAIGHAPSHPADKRPIWRTHPTKGEKANSKHFVNMKAIPRKLVGALLPQLRFLVRASLLALVISPLNAVVIHVDFEEFASYANGTPPPDFLSGYGISSVVTPAPGLGDQIYNFAPYNSDISIPSGDIMWGANRGASSSPTGNFYTTITFAQPVAYFQFTGFAEESPLTYGFPGWQAQAFDALNAVVDTDGVGWPGSNGGEYGLPNTIYHLSGANPITSVVFSVNYQSTTMGTIYVDDFEYDLIPEPSGLIIVAIALLAGFCASGGRRSAVT